MGHKNGKRNEKTNIEQYLYTVLWFGYRFNVIASNEDEAMEHIRKKWLIEYVTIEKTERIEK